MFPDSEISGKMQLSREKVRYLICFGIAPYFEQTLKDDVRFASKVVVCFDESFNKIAKKQQMDVAVRFWDDASNLVVTRYLGSTFLGHSDAPNLVAGFKKTLGLDKIKEDKEDNYFESQKMVQISMDGPRVNWNFLELIASDLKKNEDDPDLLNVGSCGLHVVHGAFQYGFLKTEWKVASFLKAIYNVFKHSPARRADFIECTKCETFPMKFCDCRWLENKAPCERAIELVPHLKKYFDANPNLPKTWSVNTARELLQEPLLLPKLKFFCVIAADLEPFLTLFQTPKPMFPFLHGALKDLFRDLCDRFVQPSVLKEAKSTYKLLHVNFEDAKNCLKLSELQIGVSTELELKKSTAKDVDKHKFRLECKQCLVKIVRKLAERSPLKYKFVEAASCLAPACILDNPGQCKTWMDSCLQILLAAKHIGSLVADRGSSQYKRFVSSMEKSVKKFNEKTDRLDTFFANLLAKDTDYKELWIVVKLILIFSHGNAFVEGGFSVNRELLIENLGEESLVALRRVWDGIQYAGGETGVEVNQAMLRYARGSHARYKDYLQKKKDEEDDAQQLSRYEREEKKRKKKELEELEKERELLQEKQKQIESKMKKLKK